MKDFHQWMINEGVSSSDIYHAQKILERIMDIPLVFLVPALRDLSRFIKGGNDSRLPINKDIDGIRYYGREKLSSVLKQARLPLSAKYPAWYQNKPPIEVENLSRLAVATGVSRAALEKWEKNGQLKRTINDTFSTADVDKLVLKSMDDSEKFDKYSMRPVGSGPGLAVGRALDPDEWEVSADEDMPIENRYKWRAWLDEIAKQLPSVTFDRFHEVLGDVESSVESSEDEREYDPVPGDPAITMNYLDIPVPNIKNLLSSEEEPEKPGTPPAPGKPRLSGGSRKAPPEMW